MTSQKLNEEHEILRRFMAVVISSAFWWDRVLDRVLGKGSQKGSEKGVCYGFYIKKGF